MEMCFRYCFYQSILLTFLEQEIAWIEWNILKVNEDQI